VPKPKSEFDAVYPCDFYAPEELLADDQMYTVYEIARLLQDLDPDAALEPGEEEILLDWAIPWVIDHADQLVIAEPPTDADPGFYGLRTDEDTPRESAANPATNGVGEPDPDTDS
jgi:hypothetical protein